MTESRNVAKVLLKVSNLRDFIFYSAKIVCIGHLFCKQFELKVTKKVLLPSIERKQRKSFNFASRSFRLVGEYVLNFLIGQIKNEEKISSTYRKHICKWTNE